MEYSGVISEEEARAKILRQSPHCRQLRVSLGNALDRFAATDLFATIPLPPFDNSAMDGYAVVAGSAGKNARLKIVGEQPAGPSKNLSLSASEAVRIFTGAPIPTGADAVVMQEETEREGDFVLILRRTSFGGRFRPQSRGRSCYRTANFKARRSIAPGEARVACFTRN